MRRAGHALLALAGLLVAVSVWVWLRNTDDVDLNATAPLASTPALVARGAYLARAGNCLPCHTPRGAAPYTGGRAIETPFGTVFSSNLTPDAETGLGRWTPAHFWRALHHGRSRDGRLLYPTFPYPNTTRITRADADALFAYLQSLPPVRQAPPANTLRWPYSSQAALAVWRALYFRPGEHRDDPRQSAAWNRGAYLIAGLGHCAACHSPRNALGANGGPLDLSGGLMTPQNWYAPSLRDPAESSVADWPLAEIVRLLQTGTSTRATVSGPMAEVVRHGTQYLSETDLTAMATYLQALPSTGRRTERGAPPPSRPSGAERGARLYDRHCAQCHGDQGKGVPGAYPALAGNRAVTLAQPANLVQMVLYGGFAPATTGNPRPYGMPPYVLMLDDRDIAAVLTHLRTSWGHQAAEVSELDVHRVRAATAP